MSRVEIVSKVGSDGVLRLAVPLPAAEAGRDVRVTVEPLARPAMTQDEWRAFVLRTAGTWQGEFERAEQGEYEERDPLP
ncbi:MAG TPA: hypothetical protein VKD90_28665 [Gemmataceae bacterium]|nr:hypothetical protein [Gemmataceae bacterium]